MKAFISSPAHLSRAMFRVDKALARYAPPSVEVVEQVSHADFVVVPVIGYPETAEAIRDCRDYGQSFAMIQYCMRTTQKSHTLDWLPLWQQASCVWSYYDLPAMLFSDNPELTEDQRCIPFFHAPLGVDAEFALPFVPIPRTLGAVTTGYVSGPSAEAIEEVAVAAGRLGQQVAHVGPFPVGMTDDKSPGPHWRFHLAISDQELADLYRSSHWVSGLRHGEGFELPVLEGLCCGARPILFDRSEMRYWYDGHAVFVPECAGEELIDHLVRVMSCPPERRRILQRFNWQSIASDFWSRIFQGVGQ
jgi:glycosyltransferase involved in cell wall biosynthesis